MQLQDADPTGLIRESYRIEGITPGECRTIFLQWTLGLPIERDTFEALRDLIAAYVPKNPGHPMNEVLNAALSAPPATGRRGGPVARRA